ncbi:hypothetical protein [Marixanthomonas spongiae]|nr:hypothetical protein [Marixanthomonas spongiae]
MKKSILAIAIALGTLTAVQAQDKAIAQKTTDKAPAILTAQAPAQEDYKEIKASELPKPVLEAVAKEFEGATVSKAYKNEQGEYKLVLATAGMAQKTVYANAQGEWIKKQ